jgi:hypothetical protein
MLIRVAGAGLTFEWLGRAGWVVPTVEQWSDRFSLELVLPQAGGPEQFYPDVVHRRREWLARLDDDVPVAAASCGLRLDMFFVRLTFRAEAGERAPGRITIVSTPPGGDDADLRLDVVTPSTRWFAT